MIKGLALAELGIGDNRVMKDMAYFKIPGLAAASGTYLHTYM